MRTFFRPEFRLAWISAALVIVAFVFALFYVPLPWKVVEACLLVVIIILIFLVAHPTTRVGSVTVDDERELRVLLSSIPDPLIIYDADFRVAFFNGPAEKLFNLSASSLVGHVLSPRDAATPAWQVLTQTIFPSLAPRVVSRSKEGVWPQVFDISFTDPELELRVITASVSNKNGTATSFLKIIHDRTSELAALHSKSEFLTIASHQFRGPATDINWALQSLETDTTLSENSKMIVDNALAASQGLTQRIEDLLNIAKMEEGQEKYDFETTNIVEFVGKVLSGVLPAAQKAGIKMYFDRPENPLPSVTIDQKQISIVLVNLLENAIRYNIENGEVIVRVDPVPDKPFVKVSVKDTGIGIPEDANRELFKKFFRAENAIQSQTEGSGLGLYIARGIVTAHGGEIATESVLGRGTTVYFTLPTDSNLIPKYESDVGGLVS